MAFANQNIYYNLPELEIVSQQLNSKPFFIDLIQLNVKKPKYIKFHTNHRQLFLYFTIKGTMLYVDEAYKPIIRTFANSFMMSYYDTGNYFGYAKEGIHISLVVSIHLD